MAFTELRDIYNRALQHIGRNRVGEITEPTSQALEISACQDGLRLAELQRNNWRFAIRSARLRPIETTTLHFTPSAWAVGTAYSAGAVVTYTGADGKTYWWQLYAATSTGEQPDISATWQHYFGPVTLDIYDSSASYDRGELAKGSNTSLYLSLINDNTTDPVTAPAGNWRLLAGTAVAEFIPWPAGVGPASVQGTQNLYRLPFGYLKMVPQAPKAGMGVYLGILPGQPRLDWTFEGDYFYSANTQPVLFRFVADVADVTKMTPMFCEMWASRIASEVAMSLCDGKEVRTVMTNAATHYSQEAASARLMNMIEIGPTFSPVDDYIACRQ